MESHKVLEVQNQIRENSDELQKYLLDLESWEREMKKKEEDLKLIQTVPDEEIPPVRNLLYRSKRKNRHKKLKDKNHVANKTSVTGTDYQAWEKFDVNSELKQIDEEAKQSSASENSENEDEFCRQKRKQLAILHKDKGNAFFKSGNYDSAINSYTTGIQLDPENPLLAANRAMAFLKKEQYQSAENDCTLCLSIDPTYVKAYLRRGTARKNLNKISLAKADFSKVLEFEPDNKQAHAELKNLAEKTDLEDNSNIPESEVVKTQELWPQFIGNKTVKPVQEPNQNVLPISNEENVCIFPDSSSVMPEKPSTPKIDLDSEVQIEVMEMDESDFVKTVEKNMNDTKVLEFRETSPNVPQNDEFEPPLPCVPNSSFQFLADWNEIDSYPNLRYKYLKQFPPEMLPVIFKHYMEPVVFPKLIETLNSSFVEHGDDVYDYLKYLADIGRFNTMLMFLSDREEKDLKNLLAYVKTSKRPECEISYILKKYGV